jgi:hypothetical protein
MVLFDCLYLRGTSSGPKVGNSSVTLIAVTESYLDWPAGYEELKQTKTPNPTPKDNKGKQNIGMRKGTTMCDKVMM